MKKKIVALLCATVLAFGAPTVAFGVDDELASESESSNESEYADKTFDDIKYGLCVLKNLKVAGVSDFVNRFQAKYVEPASLPSNALSGSAMACEFMPGKQNWDEAITSPATQRVSISFTYEIGHGVFSDLPSSVNEGNLYIAGRYVNNIGGEAQVLPAQKVELNTSATTAVSVSGVVSDVFPGVLTLWIQSAASDGGLPVSGNTGISASGDLKGENIPTGVVPVISADKLTSGQAFDALRTAVGSGDMLGVFEVSLEVNGKPIHDKFGKLHLNFPVGSQYNGRIVTVWHRHNNGTLTWDVTRVSNGSASITVTDLSAFAIELGGSLSSSAGYDEYFDVPAAVDTAKVDESVTSPKTGQSIPAGTAALALGATFILGVTSVLLARRRMTR